MFKTLGALLPTLLRLVNFILDKIGATSEERKAVVELIQASKDDATASIKTKDDFNALRERLKARMAAEKESAKNSTPPTTQA